MRWTVRDWTSVVIGWVCGAAMVVLLPEEPWKLLLVFSAGFVSAWLTRLIIRI
jgi:hypothetical protein